MTLGFAVAVGPPLAVLVAAIFWPETALTRQIRLKFFAVANRTPLTLGSVGHVQRPVSGSASCSRH